ncbi:ABC-type molybdate transport system substrate-binding protein [Actinokineospora baliensis]|uniref:substrate-binding and VWA domain-containing protein n=1 Tax=Actinokineospora baliensis TaxID=547056 RepID=UPI00195A97AB|nr:substrate-binding and VWA domain-containing protein [Actinokineospora baliensis]MBM7771659.1 ABC-type molybdate transport system substrate-binding protein [Actinokineospora baliensis]
MGRHSSPRRPKWGFRSTALLLVVLLALVVGGWFALDTISDRPTTASCEPATLTVVAAPDLAPIVQAAGARITDGCTRVQVNPLESGAAAESLIVSDGTQAPDVWIPESTLWLRRAHQKGAWSVELTGTPVASTPVVLAMTEEIAAGLGWPGTKPTWAQALEATSIGISDPARDPSGLSTLLGINTATAATPDPPAAATASLRKLALNTLPQTADLYARLPGTNSPSAPLSVFPTPESSLLRHNATNTAFPLIASYAAVPSLDFPYTVLPTASQASLSVSQRLLAELGTPSSLTALGDAGFRGPDGAVLRDRSADGRTSIDQVAPVPLPSTDEVDQLLNQWAGVNLSSRMQVLLDVSGSMAEPVPGTGADRMAVTVKAAELGIGLFRPTTKFGMWLFSTNLDGSKDYRELLPVLPVAEQLNTGALEKLRSVKAIKGGATGLYDSVLAAYQSARENWEPGRINLVVVLTDGKNEDPDGISRSQLLEELAKLQDPRRPLQLIGIGIGPDADLKELEAITGPTGGQAFVTPDPTKIGAIFYKALSGVLCQPPGCNK